MGSTTPDEAPEGGSQRAPLELIVDDLMVTGVVSLDPDTTVGRARELMLGLGIHGLPVVDDVGEVVGIVTSSDLVEEWPHGEPVSAIMSSRVLSIQVDAPVVEAAEEMLNAKIHHLLVRRGEQPVGILSSLDLLAAIVS